LEARTEPSLENSAAEGPAVAGSTRRVLVADDHQDSASSLAMMLQLLGNEVRVARDGLDAVGLAERFRPQVILMDLGMPNLDGYEATRRIREQPWGAEVVIVALTGWGQEADRVKSKAAGCDAHLVKPVDLPDLEKILAEL
jgi:CheY-like chemotaxis protein